MIEVASTQREHERAPAPCMERMNEAGEERHGVVGNHAGFHPTTVDVRHSVDVLLHAQPEERQRKEDRHPDDGVESPVKQTIVTFAGRHACITKGEKA